MKKWMQKVSALALAAAMLCGCAMGVSAAGSNYYNRIATDSVSTETGYTLELQDKTGAKVEPQMEDGTSVYKDVEKLELTIENADDEQYVILLLSGEEEIPTASNIRYIDQDNKATFTLYPDQMKTVGKYNVVVASTSTPKTVVASFTVAEPPYILGDVDGDTVLTVNDAVKVLKKIVGSEEFAEGSTQFMAADVDGDHIITVNDAVKILRAIVESGSLS